MSWGCGFVCKQVVKRRFFLRVSAKRCPYLTGSVHTCVDNVGVRSRLPSRGGSPLHFASPSTTIQPSICLWLGASNKTKEDIWAGMLWHMDDTFGLSYCPFRAPTKCGLHPMQALAGQIAKLVRLRPAGSKNTVARTRGRRLG